MEFKHTIEYEDGELILMEGGQSDRNIYVLLEGQARVTKETDKGQVILALLQEGDVFGEASFLAQTFGSRSASIAARVAPAQLNVHHDGVILRRTRAPGPMPRPDEQPAPYQ